MTKYSYERNQINETMELLERERRHSELYNISNIIEEKRYIPDWIHQDIEKCSYLKNTKQYEMSCVGFNLPDYILAFKDEIKYDILL